MGILQQAGQASLVNFINLGCHGQCSTSGLTEFILWATQNKLNKDLIRIPTGGDLKSCSAGMFVRHLARLVGIDVNKEGLKRSSHDLLSTKMLRKEKQR